MVGEMNFKMNKIIGEKFAKVIAIYQRLFKNFVLKLLSFNLVVKTINAVIQYFNRSPYSKTVASNNKVMSLKRSFPA
jgi:hypothetical protein